MNHEEFEAVIHEVLASLPAWVHDGLHNIDVLVVDEPTGEHDPAEELYDEIAKTLIHEIAHYFGIEDDHLDDIGWG